MFNRFITIDKEIFSFYFGIKGLIILSQNLNTNDEQELINLKFSLAIHSINDEPIPAEKQKTLLQSFIDSNGIDYVSDFLNECLKDSCNGDITRIKEIEALYVKAIGELGITPAIFYDMTLYELDLAYKGYLARKELEANCFLIALRESKNKKANLISLIGTEGCNESTLEVRENTFNTLGIL